MENNDYIRPKLKAANPVTSYLQKTFINDKLNNWLGFLIIGSVAGLFGYLIAENLLIGFGLMAMVIGLSVVLICMLNTEWGLYISMVYCFLASHLSRFLFNDQLPVGILTDIILGATFIGLFFGKYPLKKNFIELFSSRPILFLTLVVLYLCLQIANPEGHSPQGWFHIIRKMIESLAFLFIAYNLFSDYRRITRFIKGLFICACITGLYGCLQQWRGLFGFEEIWVRSDQTRYELIYILGTFRKFSFLAGPTEFGILMAACALLFIIIGVYEKKPWYKYSLFAGSLIMILGMSYSGTRTANAMIVGGAALFILLTFHKKATKIFAFFAVMGFLFIMYAPIYNNLTILRFRSSFESSEDASYNVRELNRASVQPYIYSHPFGGGLSTTGEVGKKFNPGHALAGFPTDSGYLSKALETGWIGLLLSCILYFLTLQYAIQGYFSAKANRIKVLFAAAAAFLFSFYIGEITQEAVGLFTNMVVYYPVLAIIVRLRQFSKKEQTELSEQ